MYQFEVDFVKKMQFYAISQLRQNPDYLEFCQLIGDDYNDLKKVSEFILKSVNIDEAEGIWLDYLAWLVGTSRQYINLNQLFFVNVPHINVPKNFYFVSRGINVSGHINDNFLRRRIYAKIAYNNSKGTRNENNFIIKNLTNAERVIIKRVAPMLLDVTLIGDIDISFSRRTDLEPVIGNGVGIRHINVLSSLEE